MPQLELTSFSSQIFGLVTCIIFYYSVFWSFGWKNNTIIMILKKKLKINNNLKIKKILYSFYFKFFESNILNLQYYLNYFNKNYLNFIIIIKSLNVKLNIISNFIINKVGNYLHNFILSKPNNIKKIALSI